MTISTWGLDMPKTYFSWFQKCTKILIICAEEGSPVTKTIWIGFKSFRLELKRETQKTDFSLNCHYKVIFTAITEHMHDMSWYGWKQSEIVKNQLVDFLNAYKIKCDNLQFYRHCIAFKILPNHMLNDKLTESK